LFLFLLLPPFFFCFVGIACCARCALAALNTLLLHASAPPTTETRSAFTTAIERLSYVAQRIADAAAVALWSFLLRRSRELADSKTLASKPRRSIRFFFRHKGSGDVQHESSEQSRRLSLEVNNSCLLTKPKQTPHTAPQARAKATPPGRRTLSPARVRSNFA
jgi:hypothetical protein